MKIKFLPLIVILLLYACEPVEPEPESEYSAILMTRTELEQSIKLLEPRAVKNPGKIYIYNQFLFINERYYGVHVYDNSDPENPLALGFIFIPGNVDVAVEGSYIYVDNAVDLVTLEFDGTSLTEVDRNREIFPEIPPPDANFIPAEFSKDQRPANTVIVRWE